MTDPDPSRDRVEAGEPPRRVVPPPAANTFRLAEILAALSLVSDLARAHPPEEAMRACLLATALGRRLGLPESQLGDVYYATLLRYAGCAATGHEYAQAFGDDVAVRARGDMIDTDNPREVLGFLTGLGPKDSASARIRFLARLPALGGVAAEGARADCEAGAMIVRRCGLPPGVQDSLLQMFERWDGKRSPLGLKGDVIALPARIAAVAYVAVMFEAVGGAEASVSIIGRWSGLQLDPALAHAFLGEARDLLEVSRPDDPLRAVVAAEPGSARFIPATEFDEVLYAFADAADLKSPFLQGHSRGVAILAEDAAKGLGLAPDDVAALRRAGLLHDLGRVGTSTAIWEKPGTLSVTEREEVRLHPYHTERILSRTAALLPLSRLASLHHERVDGSGYFRGAGATQLDRSARILGAADVYQALTEERPHRAAFEPAAATRTILGLPLDRDAVEAVLAAAGHPPRRVARREYPAGLTAREVQVLGLLVRGKTEREIAHSLVISPSTVHTHVVHVYEKAGVSTRAGAALFAMEHDLIQVMPVPPGGTKID